jgi:hypothetical protein
VQLRGENYPVYVQRQWRNAMLERLKQAEQHLEKVEQYLQKAELRLHKLEDIEAIKDLKIRYWQSIDQQQPDTTASCLLPEAVIDMEGAPSKTGQELIEFIRRAGCRDNLFNLHAGQNPRIEITGVDSAVGYWDALFTSIDLETRLTIQMTGSYVDEYLRREGRWWIAAINFRQTSFLMKQIVANGASQTLSMGKNNTAAFDR